MPKDKRSFIFVVDTMPEHPKIEALSDAAFRLLMTTWCYCGRQLNDGVLPLATWRRRGTPRTRRELEEAGLVEIDGERALIHDWSDHQRTAESTRELTEKRAAAGAAGGRAKAAKRLASAKASVTSDAVALAKQVPSKKLASPLANSGRVEKKREEETTTPPGAPGGDAASGEVQLSGPTAQTLVAEWIDHCGDRPPQQVTGQIARHVGAMLAQGIPYPEVRAGLQAWQERGLAPSVLPSVVHELRTASTRRPRTNGNRNGHGYGLEGIDFEAAMAEARAIDAADAARGVVHR